MCLGVHVLGFIPTNTTFKYRCPIEKCICIKPTNVSGREGIIAHRVHLSSIHVKDMSPNVYGPGN
jgi:hypothetical protein